MNKIKYLFSICFVAVFIFCMSVSVKAEETEIDTSVFEYEENEDGTITITGYTGTDATVTIPSEIDGKSVVSIGRSAFYKCETIRQLVISEGITGMEDAFTYCENLETVSFPNTLKSIGRGAFSDCIKLNNINLPDGLVSIGDYSFLDCIKLNNINLPDGLTSIGQGAFTGCTSLTSINIPDTVQIIKRSAFDTCTSLININIPYGLHIIEDYTFRYCISLTDINIPNTVQQIGKGAFRFCYSMEKIVIPESVIQIGEDAFFKRFHDYILICADPKSYAKIYADTYDIKFSCLNTHDWDNGIITVEPTIKSEGQITYTCTVCGTKKTETLPTAATPKKGKTISAFNSQDVYKVTKSGTKNGTVEFAETNNIAITEISIPDIVTISGITYKVTSVAKNAFKSNKNLEKITIGKNVAKINAGAFNGCKNLSVINIKSKKLSFIGKNAFKGIKAKAKIKVPSSRLSKYKKLFVGKGQKSTVKITK